MARKWLGPPRERRKPVIPGGTWLERHPTRYGFDPDVRRMVDDMFRKFAGISINTYDGHPEFDETRSWGDILGYNTQRRSLDTWDAAGRGVPIDPDKGQRVVNFIFNYPGIPYVSWCIWRGWIWTRDSGEWRPWDDDGTGPHFDHPHVTMMPRGWRPGIQLARIEHEFPVHKAVLL